MSTRWRRLIVDLRPGVDDEEWDQLLDTIIGELPALNRVRFLVPEDLARSQAPLLDALVHVLTVRGVDVERREIR
jgi:hypothetical protein